MDDYSSAHESDCESGEERNDPKDNRPDEPQKNHKNPYYDCFLAWIEPYLPPPVSEESETGKRRKHFQEHQKLFIELAGFAFAIVGFIVVISQLGILIWQSSILHGQLDEMRKTRIEDGRAWIDPYQVNSTSDDNWITWYLVAHFKNIGRTPALKVSVDVFWSKDIIPLKDIVINKGPTSTLWPNGEIIATNSVQPINMLINLRTNHVPIYVYQFVSYEDIFGKEHFFRSREKQDVISGISQPSPNGEEIDTNN
jgi:hypothetical protein